MNATDNAQVIAQQLLENLHNSTIEVPMLPEVAGRVVRLTQDPDSSAADLSRLIQSDQTLAGHVMTVANSAAYSLNANIVSLQQATARLGIRMIADIALSASINSKLFDAPGFEEHITDELKFSLLTGLWGKEIARSCRKNVEAAFLGGLLHDIGRPVVIQNAIDIAKKLATNLATEEALWIENHCQREVGIQVIEQWSMPPTVSDVARHFDDYTQAGDAKEATMMTVAGAAFASFFMAHLGKNQLTLEELAQLPVLADLNLYQDEIEALLEKAPNIMQTMEQMFQ